MAEWRNSFTKCFMLLLETQFLSFVSLCDWNSESSCSLLLVKYRQNRKLNRSTIQVVIKQGNAQRRTAAKILKEVVGDYCKGGFTISIHLVEDLLGERAEG